MLEGAMAALRAGAGIDDVADLGVVHSGAIGYSRCDVSAGIEHREGAWYLRIEVEHSRGETFRKTRVVKWPYSREGLFDLPAVVADLRIVRDGPDGSRFTDRRTGAGRLFDRLLRRRTAGVYTFGSVLPAQPEIVVTAEIVEQGGRTHVCLVEKTPGRGYIMAHLPHAAFGDLCRTLEAVAASR